MKHHVAISLRKSEDKAGDIGCNSLSESTKKDYQEHNPQHVDTREESAYIDKHAHTYQEIGNKQGITNKLYAVHQRRHVRDITVENQSREESAEDALTMFFFIPYQDSTL